MGMGGAVVYSGGNMICNRDKLFAEYTSMLWELSDKEWVFANGLIYKRSGVQRSVIRKDIIDGMVIKNKRKLEKIRDLAEKCVAERVLFDETVFSI